MPERLKPKQILNWLGLTIGFVGLAGGVSSGELQTSSFQVQACGSSGTGRVEIVLPDVPIEINGHLIADSDRTIETSGGTIERIPSDNRLSDSVTITVRCNNPEGGYPSVLSHISNVVVASNTDIVFEGFGERQLGQINGYRGLVSGMETSLERIDR